MEANVPSFFSYSKIHELWFNFVFFLLLYSTVVLTSGLPSPIFWNKCFFFISIWNRAKLKVRNIKDYFLHRYCRIFVDSLHYTLWHFSKILTLFFFVSSSFPLLLYINSTLAVLYSAETELFSHSFTSNSTLSDSGSFPFSSPLILTYHTCASQCIYTC